MHDDQDKSHKGIVAKDKRTSYMYELQSTADSEDRSSLYCGGLSAVDISDLLLQVVLQVMIPQ